MTIHESRMRRPGPQGIASQNPPHARGPLSIVPPVLAAPKGATRKKKAARKTLVMPAPAGDNKTKLVRDVDWGLYDGGQPSEKDVQQGELKNCPLASLLAALAYTPKGQRHLKGMISEKKDAVEVDLSGVMDELDDGPASKKLQSNRYFVVDVARKSYEVSAALYTDDADRNWSPIYMRSPTECLWPCIAEKAYAKHLGNYGDLDTLYGKGKTLNEIWVDVAGVKPSGFEVTDKTPNADIVKAAKAAKSVPTVAASKLKLAMGSGATRWHGFVVLGMVGGKIRLYDAMKLKTLSLSLDEFRSDFLAVLHGL